MKFNKYLFHKDYLAGILLKVKKDYFNEYYVSYLELNYIRRELVKRLKENMQDICVGTKLREQFFIMNKERVCINDEKNITPELLVSIGATKVPNEQAYKIIFDYEFYVNKINEFRLIENNENMSDNPLAVNYKELEDEKFKDITGI